MIIKNVAQYFEGFFWGVERIIFFRHACICNAVPNCIHRNNLRFSGASIAMVQNLFCNNWRNHTSEKTQKIIKERMLVPRKTKSRKSNFDN